MTDFFIINVNSFLCFEIKVYHTLSLRRHTIHTSCFSWDSPGMKAFCPIALVSQPISQHSPTPGTSAPIERICFIKNDMMESDTGHC